MMSILIIILLTIVGINLLNWILDKPERMIIILMLNYIKFILVYLFMASTDIEIVSFLGMQIYANDIIMLLMVLVLILGLKKNLRIRRNILVIGLISIIISTFISLFIGMVKYGLTSQFIGDLRTFAYFFITLVYCLRYYDVIAKSKLIIKNINVTMNLFIVFSYIIWILDVGFGINNFPGQIGGTLSDGGTTMRFAHPNVVLILAIYTCYLLYYDLSNKGKGVIKPKTLVYAITVIIFQQRTVWVSFLVGLVCVFIILVKNKKIPKIELIIQIIGIAFIGGAFIILSDSKIVDSILLGLNSFKSISEGTGTYSTRTTAWYSLLESLNGFEYLIGQPFGRGYSGTIGWGNSPHNGYVQLIMRMGYIGLAWLGILIINLIVKAYNQKEYFVIVVVAIIATFWWGYGFTLEEGALLGYCIGQLLNRKEVTCND